MFLPSPSFNLLKSTLNLNCKMDIPSIQIAAVVPPASTTNPDVQITTSYPVPRPGEGEVLVKLEFSGLCYSDVPRILREKPMSTDVAGHEGIGKVVQGR